MRVPRPPAAGLGHSSTSDEKGRVASSPPKAPQRTVSWRVHPAQLCEAPINCPDQHTASQPYTCLLQEPGSFACSLQSISSCRAEIRLFLLSNGTLHCRRDMYTRAASSWNVSLKPNRNEFRVNYTTKLLRLKPPTVPPWNPQTARKKDQQPKRKGNEKAVERLDILMDYGSTVHKNTTISHSLQQLVQGAK